LQFGREDRALVVRRIERVGTASRARVDAVVARALPNVATFLVSDAPCQIVADLGSMRAAH
jgi:hypothetical protein